jgi:lipopolysaccharide transport system permease protein
MTRIYVPRLIMPVAAMSPAFFNLAISLSVLVAALIYYRATTGINHLTPPNLGWALVALALTIVLALGLSLWTSVPALQARDVRFTIGYVLGFWVFLTPVLYPLNVAPERQWLLALNPMAAIVNAFKYGVLGIPVLNVQHLAVSAAIGMAILVSGFWFFSRAEATAADKV